MVNVPEMDAFGKMSGNIHGFMFHEQAKKAERKSSRIEAKKRAQVVVVPDILSKKSTYQDEEIDHAVPELNDTFFNFNESTVFSNQKVAGVQEDPVDIFQLKNWDHPYKLDLDFDDILREWDDQTIYNNFSFEEPTTTASLKPTSEDESKDSTNTIVISPTATSKDEFARNRRLCLERYREKKRNRKFNKKVRYVLRKMNADRRPRYKGRFIKKGEVIPVDA